MTFLFQRFLKVFGWQRLLLLAWNHAYPALKKKAAGTEPEWDDAAVEFINDALVAMTGAPKDVPKPEGK